MSGHERHSTDAPASSQSAQSTETSHNLLGNIWSHVKSTAGDVKDGVVHGANVANEKAHEIAAKPEVQAAFHKGTKVATDVGKDVGRGVMGDVNATKSDVQHGNYFGAAVRVGEVAAFGPAKVLAPHVIKAGMDQLPAGTRQTIENSTVGRTATNMLAHGEIPTSAGGLARMAISGGKHELVNQAVDGAKHKAVEYAQSQQHPAAGGGDRQAATKDAPANTTSSTQTAPNWFSKIPGMESKAKH